MTDPTFKIDQRFKKKVQSYYERFGIQGGILEDKPHRIPKPAKPVKKTKAKPKAEPKVKSKSRPKPKAGKKKKKKGFLSRFKNTVKKNVKKRVKKVLSTKEMKHALMVSDHRRRGLGTLEGGPVRLMQKRTRGTVAEVGEAIRKIHKVDYLREPFKDENSPDMKKLRKALANLLKGKAGYSKVETAFRAVLRNPILKRKYGANSAQAKRVKTFDRKLIDTGQFFKAIKAKVRVKK